MIGLQIVTARNGILGPTEYLPMITTAAVSVCYCLD